MSELFEPPPDPQDMENQPPSVGSSSSSPKLHAGSQPGETQLSRLDQTMEGVLRHLEKLGQKVAAHEAILAEDDGRGAKDKPAAWLHTDPPPTTLPDWVEWFNEMYEPTQRVNRIPACWREHPGLLAELSTLWWSWRVAFIGRQASATDAQNWHDRWLPGFQARMKRWTGSDCLAGHHKPKVAAGGKQRGRGGVAAAVAAAAPRQREQSSNNSNVT